MHTTRNASDRPRMKDDFYETPHGLCKAALNRLLLNLPDQDVDRIVRVLDPGFGTGHWGHACRHVIEDVDIDGIDINSEYPLNLSYNALFYGDYLSHDLRGNKYDLIMGNPPYKYMEEFIRKSQSLLNDLGFIYFLTRLEFLASKKRHFGLFLDFHPSKVYVLTRRPSFFSVDEKHHSTDAQDYCMILWQKGNEPKTVLDWLYWDYDEYDRFPEGE